jgi:GH43 family beta-xylosidase
LVTVALAALPAARSQATFTNPLFSSQDPYVVWWQGFYYYSDSDGDSIYLRKSPALSGLATEPARAVWTATRRGPDGHAGIWAPEIHMIGGKSYLYFAADYEGRGDRRLYVLEGGADPMGAYKPGDTGDPDGRILESTGRWGIDPNVFFGPDGQLYLTWSCTGDNVGAPPQSICLARMSDPLHVSSAAVQISTPTEPWETRTAAIQEGPAGFTRQGAAYITYSGSASWTANDYAVGLLVNTSGDLLDPSRWVKRGPIFDRHGKSYGPGSVVFVPSPDASELWTLYHAYDRLNCAPWGCRSIRMQKVAWTPEGMPLLGYPADPGVPGALPSGDRGLRSGWGDARLGAAASGSWLVRSSISLDSLQHSGDRTRQEIFRGETNLFSYVVSAKIRHGRTDSLSGKYGVYGLYQDGRNCVEAFIDPVRRLFATGGAVAGEDLPLHEFPLPPRFSTLRTHTITIRKTAAQQFLFELDGTVTDRRGIPLVSGQIGVFTENGGAQFREVVLADTSSGWGNAFGDAAEGRTRSPLPVEGDGYVRGDWLITDAASAAGMGLGAGWHTLYQGDPNYGSYEVRVDARWVESGTDSEQPRYGLIVCYDDRDNNVSMWVDPRNRQLSLKVVLGGNSTWRDLPLPADFDESVYHDLGASKRDREFVFLLDGREVFRDEIALVNGTSGIATEDMRASFRNYRRRPLP